MADSSCKTKPAQHCKAIFFLLNNKLKHTKSERCHKYMISKLNHEVKIHKVNTWVTGTQLKEQNLTSTPKALCVPSVINPYPRVTENILTSKSI